MTMTKKQALEYAVETLQSAGVDNSRFEAWMLLDKHFALTRTGLTLHGEEPASADDLHALIGDLQRRVAGEPLQYLLGMWEFFGLAFFLGPGVLIPRPDTERLVELAIGQAPRESPLRILDLCAGSGCLAITLAKQFPRSSVTAVELYDVPLSYIGRNALLHGANNLTVCQMDVLIAPPAEFLESFDLIVSNPPYIPTGEMPTLQREVQHEPAEALDGGADGMTFYRAVRDYWLDTLCPGGTLLLECGDGQHDAVRRMFSPYFEKTQAQKDYNGLYRTIHGTVKRIFG